MEFKKPIDLFSLIYMGGFFLVLCLVLSGLFQIPESLRDTANIMIGVLSTGIIKILDYRYGSSIGSKQKTALLNNRNPV